MMTTALPYKRIIHADWSISPRKRWAAVAVRTKIGWTVEAPRQVNDTKLFLDFILKGPYPTLAGFDFAIGLPEFYGEAINLPDFCTALDTFGTGRWSEFYNVANEVSEISLFRPFYPQRSSSAARQSHLTAALGCESIDQLRRKCELATSSRRAACSLFWTLGGNQVGKAAISGWREIVIPARERGAKIWPFEGSLGTLVEAAKLTLAETYPAEAYRHVGAQFTNAQSKRRQQDRAKVTNSVALWSLSKNIRLEIELSSLMEEGFGPLASGEDAFDAVMGLFGMIEVVDGRRPSGEIHPDKWEGWILGQPALQH
jgi:hypothetical protein